MGKPNPLGLGMVLSKTLRYISGKHSVCWYWKKLRPFADRHEVCAHIHVHIDNTLRSFIPGDSICVSSADFRRLLPP